MPLYSDSNYYYSGGSSQLFSPYYPGSSSLGASSSYTPYTSTYNRAIGGSYVVPISTSRSPTYGLSTSSRYQPKLSTITESSPLIGVARHSSLMPLTRINSPKYTSYSTSTPVHLPKYVPPKPILINTADIDVSANRYRRRKEEVLKQAQLEHEAQMAERMNEKSEPKTVAEMAKEKNKKESPENTEIQEYARNYNAEEEEPLRRNRSTIKRNRAVVRLSTIRSRSKDRNRIRVEDLYSPEPEEKKVKDSAEVNQSEDSNDSKDVLLEKEVLQEVVVELDPKFHTVRRLSIPQCPTFHDICEDISSDKIDDDLNAGELRRRQSVIQIQEQELLNQLQKSPSGTFQMINLERRDSHDSTDGQTTNRHSKRQSRKGNRIRHKITAIVEVDNPSQSTLEPSDVASTTDAQKSPLPKFTVNVDSIEEHHEIHKVFKLPKKKATKKVTKAKDQPLPEGFMTPIGRPETSPRKKLVEKKETFKTTAEIFTFDQKAVDEAKLEDGCRDKGTSENLIQKSESMEVKSPRTPSNINETCKKEEPRSPSTDARDLPKTEGKCFSPKQIKLDETKCDIKTQDRPETPKQTKSSDSLYKTTLEKSGSITLEPKSPTSPFKDGPAKTSDKPKVYTPKTSKSSLLLEIAVESSKETVGKLKEQSKVYTPKSSKSSLVLETEVQQKFSKPSEDDAMKSPTKILHSQQRDELKDKQPNDLNSPTKNPTSPSRDFVDTATKYEGIKSPTETLTSSSFDIVNKPKPIGKTNSITMELKSTTMPSTQSPVQSPTKETPPENLQVATPKPIRKGIKKSESGEDFWAQIGSRETLYMNKRKQELIECQWKKRENLLDSTTMEEVSNLDDIKTTVKQQKEEALKKAKADEISSQSGNIGRSSSNETALKKETVTTSEKDKKPDNTNTNKEKVESKTIEDSSKNIELKKGKLLTDEPKQGFTTKIKSDEINEKKSSPIKKKTASPKNKASSNETIKISNDTESKEAKFSDKLEISKPKISTTVTEAIAKAKSAMNITTTTTTPTKITGQLAKSPEQQEQEEQNTDKQTTQAKNSNKNELDINKTSAIATKTNDQPPSALLAKPLTAAGSNVKVTADTKASTAATKQPETKTTNATAEIKQTATVTTAGTGDAAKPTKKLQATDANKTSTPTKVKSPTPPKSKAKLSPQSVINADQFIVKAPAKPNASPVKQTKLATSITSSPFNNDAKTPSAPTKKTTDAQINKTTNATSSNDDAKASTPATTTTSVAAASTTATCGEIRKEDVGKTRERLDSDDNNTKTSTLDITGGGNLSKFATVSNLAQCLQDVDADLDDYIPSSADISEDENYTSDSDFDYSSIDGWDKFTPSMKKKIKQRRRKEKQAEQARFDPQKKVKIDTTRKLYVKEEAPRYPLVATPRPLWKREKIVYPVEDSDESDSEESGSTEETEESDECTTSEEYEDELNPTASGGGATTSGGSGNSNSDPNIIRMSTCSNDSGFEGGTAPSSPKKMLECDVNCHKKCERLTANLCGVNQKLIVEALANVKRGARETRDSPSTPPSLNPAYKIEPSEEQDETSYTYSQFQKSGRFTPPATIIPRFKNYSVDDFHFLAVLGKGSFGKVLLAELRDTTYYYAVKCLKKDVVLEDDDVDSTLIERKVLALGTKHPYLCHLFCTFQTESHLFFVMEYLNGGDLMFHIQESGRFTEERARFYGAEIISGLKFLHKKGIIYRDLKLDNVLLDYEGHVRIADFGMCKLQIYLDKTADSFCGTPDYMAPEIIKAESYNQNVDWWSFGVLLYEMLIGQSPFSGCDEDELFWSICNEIPWFPVYISAEATSILKGLLEKDSAKRIGSQYSPAGDIVEHIFFRPIDWNLLEKRQIAPPFRPQVKHPLDTQYFDRVFTRERVRLTPIDKDILQSMDQKQFLGFTYTNPHITLED